MTPPVRRGVTSSRAASRTHFTSLPRDSPLPPASRRRRRRRRRCRRRRRRAAVALSRQSRSPAMSLVLKTKGRPLFTVVYRRSRHAARA